MEVPEAHLTHTVGAGEDGQVHGVQSWAETNENNRFNSCSRNASSVFSDHSASHLAAQPQREMMHAATCTAKGSEHRASPFLFCSSSISCSKTLMTSSVKDCKKTVNDYYKQMVENDLHSKKKKKKLQLSTMILLIISMKHFPSTFLKMKITSKGLKKKEKKCFTMDFSCSGLMAGSWCARRQSLWKRSKKAARRVDGSEAGTSQNRSGEKKKGKKESDTYHDTM